MADSLLTLPSRSFSLKSVSPMSPILLPPMSPRDTIIYAQPDLQIAYTPRSYLASLMGVGPSSPASFPLSPRPSSTPPGITSTTGHAMKPGVDQPAKTSSLSTRGSSVAVPYAFVWPTQQRPTVSHDDFTTLEIPTVDLARLQATNESGANAEDCEEARKHVVSQVREACRDWGFFHVVNHGVPAELLDRVQKQAQRFFSLPKEEKLKVRRKSAGGITGYGHAAVKPTDSQPWSEGFYLANDSTVDKFAQVLWADGENKDFSDSYREYNEMVANLAKNLMDIIIEGLEVNAELFAPYINNNSSLLRWNHYPPCPQPHKSLEMSAHTDFNLLTVLHQGDVGGLQLEKDGKWIAVKPRKDALAINVGDTLQVLTNGLYKSVPHQAVVNCSQARISLAYFFAPSKEMKVAPIPDLVRNDEKLYKPFTIEEYLAVKRGQLLNTLEHFEIQPMSKYSLVLDMPFGPSTSPVPQCG